MEHDTAIIEAINGAELNRGLDGETWLNTAGNVPVVLGHPDAPDVALFDAHGDGVYEVHFLFHSRGRAAIDSARESFRRMFEDYGADMIMGLVPEIRPDVKLLARWIGGKLVGQRNTENGPCQLFVLSKEMWSTDK
jgi:hypothetical protein